MLLALVAFLLLAGCGDEGSNPELLSAKTGNAMLDDLEASNEAFEAGDCAKAERRAQKVLDRVNDLGSPPTDQELKFNLREGANALLDHLDECEPAEAAEPETEEPVEPTPTPPEPETPEEPSDSPDEEEPTPPEPTPDEPDVPAPEQPEPEPPAPEPNEPAPTPPPETPAPTPPSGGVGPGNEVNP